MVRELRRKGEYLYVEHDKHPWIKPPWVKEAHYSSWQFTRECIEHHCRACQFEWATKALV